ncbi:AI-2E family transporter [Sulfurovum sp. XGS-02]|uniref:AI-2E family transporter n=1 Tax=Sulfurovum sp. XGS-02 TaxID=2925411 RepID=UPI0020635769|nr:AI-2E family transporter [Sulfurovum sp. XGS-02]UPT78524.1 AI-2E family transporter [Sulfurovum sp. XGS-02]
MKKEIPNKFQQGFVLLLLFIALMGFIGMIHEFLIALILAAIFAGLLYPFYRKLFYHLKKRSSLAAVTTLIIAALTFGLPLAAFTGMVTGEAIEITKKARPLVQEVLDNNLSLGEQIPEWLPFKEKLEPFHETIVKKASEATNAMGSWLVSSLSSATKGTVGFFISLFIMFYAMFHFLIHGPQLLRTLSALLPLSEEDRSEVMSRGLMVTRASLKGIIIVGVVEGILVGLSLWMAGIEGSAFWGSVVFLLAAIPGLGASLIWLPAALYLLFTGSTGWGIALVVWGVLVVGMVDNILRPWIVGNDAKLPDLVILISILGGIISFGPLGIIIGPVIAALLDTILNIYKKTFQHLLPS